MKDLIPDALSLLAHRRCSYIWSAKHQVKLERDLWLSVMRHQRDLGLRGMTLEVIRDYEKVKDDIDLVSIREREYVTRHDVKARIEEFNALAGHEKAHLGMTSADIVDNISLVKMREALLDLSDRWTLPELAPVARSLPFRGIKGPVGTQQDMADLLGLEEARELDQRVARDFGFRQVLQAVPQVYHRSIDLRVVTAVHSAVVNASADVGPVRHLLSGYVAMVSGYQGDTWNEGDVSQSVVRRVALPGMFLAADVALLLAQTRR